ELPPGLGVSDSGNHQVIGKSEMYEPEKARENS
ncbi:MAG: hypothetical protein RIS97_641, partial [Pseudomonadota bacterium]